MPGIYLDNNATTSIDPAVREVMLRYMGGEAGNPSSRHASGRWARQAVEEACEKIAAGLDCHPEEITFTSGATEANNLAIGTWRDDPMPIRVLATEHPSSLLPAIELSKAGHPVELIHVDGEGLARWDFDLASGCRGVVQWANSETGTLQEIDSIRSLWPGLTDWHVDAVQAIGKVAGSFRKSGATTWALSGHKIHGPPGIGALIVRKGTTIRPVFLGGSQQAGLRPGSEPVPLIVGLGEAIHQATTRFDTIYRHLCDCRHRLEETLFARIPHIAINGAHGPHLPSKRLASTSNISFFGARAEAVLIGLDLEGVQASAGTACASGSMEPSPTLLAMGLERDRVSSAIRFSVSRFTTLEEIDQAALKIVDVVAKVRSRLSSPLNES
jgi:cysteine desulfurase